MDMLHFHLLRKEYYKCLTRYKNKRLGSDITNNEKGFMMFKKLLLSTAGAALICGSGVAFAGTVTYTFSGYCDGIKLVETDGVAVGNHLGQKCATPEDKAYAGGIEAGKLKPEGIEDTRWVITTTEAYYGDSYQEIIVLDQKAMTFEVYLQSTANGVEFQLVNSGVLVKGAPGDEIGGAKVSTRPAATP
jgi:hypothetical protein